MIKKEYKKPMVVFIELQNSKDLMIGSDDINTPIIEEEHDENDI